MKWKGILGRAGALAALVLLACALAVTAAAQTINQDRENTLTVSFGESGEGFPEVEFSLYPVASLTEEEYALTDDFAQYPVSLEDLDSSGLRSLAQTLDAYVARDTLRPCSPRKPVRTAWFPSMAFPRGCTWFWGSPIPKAIRYSPPAPCCSICPARGRTAAGSTR